MAQKDIELLATDISARVKYGVQVQLIENEETMERYKLYLKPYPLKPKIVIAFINYNVYGCKYKLNLGGDIVRLEDCKPYLRPLLSMTEEERKELEKITYHTFEYKKGERDIWTKSYHRCYLFGGDGKLYGAGEPINMLCSSELCTKLIDWLNMHHFDYRHLIEKGLALEAPKGMYNIKDK